MKKQGTYGDQVSALGLALYFDVAIRLFKVEETGIGGKKRFTAQRFTAHLECWAPGSADILLPDAFPGRRRRMQVMLHT